MLLFGGVLIDFGHFVNVIVLDGMLFLLLLVRLFLVLPLPRRLVKNGQLSHSGQPSGYEVPHEVRLERAHCEEGDHSGRATETC